MVRAYLAHAEGSPCPTLVLPASLLPTPEDDLTPALAAAHKALQANNMGDILKIALIAPCADTSFDFVYRFVQCLPGPQPRFDFRGTCGHSMLSAVLVASEVGWVPPLYVGQQISVDMRNNSETAVCQVDAVHKNRPEFTFHLYSRRQPRLKDLLLFGEPTINLRYTLGCVPISGISVGNPYVFVNAADLGYQTVAALFADDPELFATLLAIRRTAEGRLGWSPGSFPKVAALLPDSDGGVAARAISVPSWHPTLALTGVVSLIVASLIPGTVPADLRRTAVNRLVIRTKRGRACATARVTGRSPNQPRLISVSVSRKRVQLITAIDVPSVPRCPTSQRMVALATDRAIGA